MNKVLIGAIIVLIFVAGCVSSIQKNSVAPASHVGGIRTYNSSNSAPASSGNTAPATQTPAAASGTQQSGAGQSSTPAASVAQTQTTTSAPPAQQFNGLGSDINPTSQQTDTVPSGESNIPP
jgi:hypothetical protein